MAEVRQIRGTQDEVKIRSPWAPALLPIVTLGVYQVVWWYKINRELRDYGYAKEHDLGQNPTNSALALFPGALIVVPPLVSYWRGFGRVQGAATLAGQEAPNGWIALLLFLLLGPAFNAYVQVSLNDIWRQEADEGAAAALEPPAQQAPAQQAPPTEPAPQEPASPEAPPQEPPRQEPPRQEPPRQEPPA
jgi:hypothetical protein